MNSPFCRTLKALTIAALISNLPAEAQVLNFDTVFPNGPAYTLQQQGAIQFPESESSTEVYGRLYNWGAYTESRIGNRRTLPSQSVIYINGRPYLTH